MEPTRRFSDRVADYARYRPGYPPALLGLLRGELGLAAGSVVADVGSGTGILARMLLEAGHAVYGVEPNDEMRRSAECLLSGFTRFTSVAGTAEATGLPDASADLATAAQAFHWFEPAAARHELCRVLRRPAWVALLWNSRDDDRTPLLRAYEDLLLRFGTDYTTIDHRQARNPRVLSSFFGPAGWRETTFPHDQRLDWAGFQGRLRSASYLPAPGHPDHAPMMNLAREIFEAHQRDGRVTIDYDTEVYWGRLD